MLLCLSAAGNKVNARLQSVETTRFEVKLIWNKTAFSPDVEWSINIPDGLPVELCIIRDCWPSTFKSVMGFNDFNCVVHARYLNVRSPFISDHNGCGNCIVHFWWVLLTLHV